MRPWPSVFLSKKACRAALLVLAGLLLLLGALLLLFPPFGIASRGWAMLFTQRSVHSLLGALRSAGTAAPFMAIWLVASQGLFLPQLPPLIYIACAQQFGLFLGCLLALGGLCLACGFCFVLGRLLAGAFLPSLHNHWLALSLRQWGWCLAGAAALLFPAGWGLWLGGLAAGVFAGRFWHFWAGTLAPQVLWLLGYALFCRSLRTLPPPALSTALGLLAVLLVLVFVWRACCLCCSNRNKTSAFSHNNTH